MLGDHLHHAKDRNREQQTPYPPEPSPEEQRDKHRGSIHFCDLAGHSRDEKHTDDSGNRQRDQGHLFHVDDRRSVNGDPLEEDSANSGDERDRQRGN